MTFRKFSTASVLGLTLFLAPLALAAADPSGTHTGTVADLTAAKPGQPTVAELAGWRFRSSGASSATASQRPPS